MAAPLNLNSPHKLTSDLIACMARVEVAVDTNEVAFDEIKYRDQLGRALGDMKIATVRVAESAHIGGMEKIGAVAVLLKDLSAKRRSVEADEVFWDQLSRHYPVKGEWGSGHAHLSTGLQLRLLKQMISQEPEPHTVVRNQLQRMSDSAFMEGFTTALRLLEPTEIRFNTNFYEALFCLKQHVSKPALMANAVDHIAAHKELYFAFLERVMKVAAMPAMIKPEPDEEISDLVIRRKRIVLDLMGYSEQESIEMIESGAADKILPKAHEFSRMKKALAFPAEFLCMLYQATEKPLILEIAEMGVDDPSGRTPFVFLEQMGITRTPEWFIHTQEKSGLGKAVVLYEHVIHTPGLELAVDRVAHQPLTSGEPGLIERLIAIVEKVSPSNPDARRKGQQLFDAMVANMEGNKSSKLLRELLESCAIPGVFYAKHKTLKVKRLENDLGL